MNPADSMKYTIKVNKIKKAIEEITEKIEHRNELLDKFDDAGQPPEYAKINTFDYARDHNRFINELLSYYKDGDNYYMGGKRYNPYTGEEIEPYVTVFSLETFNDRSLYLQLQLQKWEVFDADRESAIEP